MKLIYVFSRQIHKSLKAQSVTRGSNFCKNSHFPILSTSVWTELYIAVPVARSEDSQLYV